MNREQMIEKVAAIVDNHPEILYGETVARDVVDALLPRVTTVAELDALPRNTVLVSDEGLPLRAWMLVARDQVEHGRPLTIMWQP